MSDVVKGPASYFPSIEKTYGRPIADWQAACSGAVSGYAVPAGHFIPEEAPADLGDWWTRFMHAGEAERDVIHAASYVSEDMAATQGRIGRSQGCFAFSNSDINGVLERLGEGRLLYAVK